MKLFDELNEDNFVLFAAKNYYNPTCIDAEEFYDDLNRFKYIKRLLTRYQETENLSVNLLVNHLVVIFNVFGIQAGLQMLEYKIDIKYWHIIKPIIIYLNVIENTQYVGIEMDEYIVNKLREL